MWPWAVPPIAEAEGQHTDAHTNETNWKRCDRAGYELNVHCSEAVSEGAHTHREKKRRARQHQGNVNAVLAMNALIATPHLLLAPWVEILVHCIVHSNSNSGSTATM